jgi:small subunit ribosomal protein S20
VANIKSQIKRIRQNERRRVRNKAVRTRLKSVAKDVATAADAGDAETASTRLREAGRFLDKAAARKTVHPRAAARRKSRLARKVAAAERTATPEQP